MRIWWKGLTTLIRSLEFECKFIERLVDAPSVYMRLIWVSLREPEQKRQRSKHCINPKREINQLPEVILKEKIIIYMDTCQLP